MRLSALVTGMACLLASTPLLAQRFSQADSAWLDSAITASLGQARVAGVSIAVAERGRIVFARAAGLADASSRQVLTAGMPFRLQSVSKFVVAAAVLRLVDEGKLSLDDRVAALLPGVPLPDASITVRHLLTHTSGLANYTDYIRDFSAAISRDSIVRLMSQPLTAAPGEREVYSNSNYYLAALLIERAAQQTLWTYLRQVTGSRLEHCTALRGLPTGHFIDSAGTTSPRGPWGEGLAFGATGLCATAADLATWTQHLHAGRVLSPPRYAEMVDPVRLNNGTKGAQGMGVMISQYNGRRSIGHGGYGEGFQALVQHLVDDSVTIVALVNTTPSAGIESRLIAGLMARWWGPDRAAAPVTSTTLPTGWTPVATASTDANFRVMGSGLHLTADRSSRFVRADSLQGEYALELVVPTGPVGYMPGSMSVSVHGIDRSLLAQLLLRGDHRVATAAGDSPAAGTWRYVEAVRPGTLTTLRIEVADSIRFRVNGTLIASQPRPALLRNGYRAGTGNIGPVDSHIASFTVSPIKPD